MKYISEQTISWFLNWFSNNKISFVLRCQFPIVFLKTQNPCKVTQFY